MANMEMPPGAGTIKVKIAGYCTTYIIYIYYAANKKMIEQNILMRYAVIRIKNTKDDVSRFFLYVSKFL